MKRMLLVMIIAVSALMANDNVYVLCEGNWGSLNSSLWMYNGTEMSGPINWNTDSNPLGDVGQSLCYSNDKLYIVMNASHMIEVLNTNTGEEISTIALDATGPREMAVYGSKGYVSCWDIMGIIVFDLNTHTLLDTINLGTCPEDIIIDNGILYTSIYMNVKFEEYGKTVLSFDITADPVPIDTFTVAGGPGQMLIDNNSLWIASTDWDASWNTIPGMSHINLETKEVAFKTYENNAPFADDIAIVNNSIYRSYLNGIVKINNDLTFDVANILGDIEGNVYSFASFEDKIYMGYTDYMAPDTVVIMDNEANILNTFQVGAIPGSFAFITGQTSVDDTPALTETFELNQNYPNPFNPTTTITYNLPKTSDVRISVYNMLGQHIVDLVNNNQTAGLQNIQWNAMDNNGNQVPTGVYFYQLKADNVSITKKMVFMK